MQNRRLVLASRPVELPEPGNFDIEMTAVPEPSTGEVLVRVRYAALSPWQGQRLKDFRNFTRPFEIGELIDCDVLGEVIASKAEEMPAGTVVTGRLGWQEYAVAEPSKLSAVDAGDDLDEKLWLTALSSPGLTAYTAFELFGRPMPGQTLAVTSAAGSVGSYAVQIGKLAGARVVGVAGGAEKCAHVRTTLGADAAVDHRSANFAAELAAACPDGVHLFFDTTGGPIADSVFDNLAKYAKVLFVGRTASNNSATPHLDYVNFRQLWAREATMIGFSRYSYDERWAFAKERMLGLCREGRIKSIDNVVEGFENSPAALRDMLAGEIHWQSTGTLLMSVNKVAANGIEFAYRFDGNPDGPVVMMAHAMGTSHRIWDRQVPALEDRFHLLRYDWRGHGDTDAPPGPYSLSQFEADAVAVMDALHLDKVHWVGISTGGMIGQGLGINYGDRLESIALCNTTPQSTPWYRDWVAERQAVVREGGMAPVWQMTKALWFNDSFIEAAGPDYRLTQEVFEATPIEGYLGGTSAVADLNYLDDLHKVDRPTLVIAAGDDPVTPVDHSEKIHARIKDSKLQVIPGQRHFSNIEVPDQFNPILRAHLDEQLD